MKIKCNIFSAKKIMRVNMCELARLIELMTHNPDCLKLTWYTYTCLEYDGYTTVYTNMLMAILLKKGVQLIIKVVFIKLIFCI